MGNNLCCYQPETLGLLSCKFENEKYIYTVDEFSDLSEADVDFDSLINEYSWYL